MGTIKKDTIQILKNGASCFGIDQPLNNSIFSMYRIFILKLSKPRNSSINKFVFTLMKFVIFIVPLLTLVIDKFLTEYSIVGEAVFFVWLFLIFIWGLFFLVDLYFPKDTDELYREANYLKALSLAERFAAQVALYSKTKTFMRDKDSNLISRLSEFTKDVFKDELLEIIKERKDIILGVKHNDDVEKTRIFIGDEIFTEEQNDNICNITTYINDAASSIFLGSNFLTKIYLVTENEILLDNEKIKIKLLTSIDKQNSYKFKNSGFRGASWIACDGEQAEVWKSVNSGISFVKKALPGYHGVYSSILFIALPGKIGALTIAADNEFAFDNMISEDALDTLGIAARDLLLKAVGIND